MTPRLSPTIDQHGGHTRHPSHSSHVRAHPHGTIAGAPGDDYHQFFTPTGISRDNLLVSHTFLSQIATSRSSCPLISGTTFHFDSQAPLLLPTSQHDPCIPVLNSYSPPPYLSGPPISAPLGTWNEVPTGEKLVFSQPLDIHIPPTSSLATSNLPPSHVSNGPPLSPPSYSTLYQHIPRSLTHQVRQQYSRSPTPQWQVPLGDTSAPDSFLSRYLSTTPSSSGHPYMGPNSGGGILHVFHPCLWVERGVICNVMVQATRSQINRHLRTCHGFSGPETRLTRCQWAGCGESMQQGSVARHMVTCHLQAKVTCPRCLKKLSRTDVMPKHQRVCPAANP